MPVDRYDRQERLPQIGADGQARIRAATVLVLGVGALGSTAADLLCRAGVGRLVLVDRDIVDLSNLQRQTLFAESDVGQAKANAAAARLATVNRDVAIDARPNDVDSGNIRTLLRDTSPTVIVDGTDNAATRYLLNEACIETATPWVYGGAVGVEGRVMPIRPCIGPCLKCVFPEMPAAGELDTCDTAGVLGPLTAIVASIQAAMAIKMIATREDVADDRLIRIDAWTMEMRSAALAGLRSDQCAACVHHEQPMLSATPRSRARLCGRSAVQVLAPKPIDLARIESRWVRMPGFQRIGPLLRVSIADRMGVQLTLFPDGRVLVDGTSDPAAAQSWCDRYLG